MFTQTTSLGLFYHSSKPLDDLSVRIQRFHIHLMRLKWNQISIKCYVNFCKTRCPTRRNIPPKLKRFLFVSSELSVYPSKRDCLLKGSRLVIIECFRSDILSKIHEGHHACRALSNASNWKRSVATSAKCRRVVWKETRGSGQYSLCWMQIWQVHTSCRMSMLSPGHHIYCLFCRNANYLF